MSELTSKQAEALFAAIGSMEEQIAQMKKVLEQAGLSADMGIVGVYEGEVMVTAEGQQHPVPANYASKTMLVSGDTLRLMKPADGGQSKYKQIGKVERVKSEGLLVRKDGKYEVLTDQGSFKILSAAAKFYELEPGDTVLVQHAKQHNRGSWAAVEKVVSRASQQEVAPSVQSGSIPVAPVVEPATPIAAASVVPSLVGSREKIAKEAPIEQGNEAGADRQESGPKQEPAAQTAKADKPAEVEAKKSPKPSAKTGRAKSDGEGSADGDKRASARGKKASASRSESSRSDRSTSSRTAAKPRSQARSQAKDEPVDLPVDQGEIVPEVVNFDDHDLL